MSSFISDIHSSSRVFDVENPLNFVFFFFFLFRLYNCYNSKWAIWLLFYAIEYGIFAVEGGKKPITNIYNSRCCHNKRCVGRNYHCHSLDTRNKIAHIFIHSVSHRNDAMSEKIFTQLTSISHTRCFFVVFVLLFSVAHYFGFI